MAGVGGQDPQRGMHRGKDHREGEHTHQREAEKVPGPALGDVLPGSVLDRQITCPQNAMSDDRVAGAFEGFLHCVFSERVGSYVGDCPSGRTLTNDGGTWYEDAGDLSITVVPGEASRVVEDGVYVGRGQYQGLRYAYHVESDSGGYPWPITGTIERSD